jgi:hypothetical protein
VNDSKQLLQPLTAQSTWEMHALTRLQRQCFRWFYVHPPTVEVIVAAMSAPSPEDRARLAALLSGESAVPGGALGEAFGYLALAALP